MIGCIQLYILNGDCIVWLLRRELVESLSHQSSQCLCDWFKSVCVVLYFYVLSSYYHYVSRQFCDSLTAHALEPTKIRKL